MRTCECGAEPMMLYSAGGWTLLMCPECGTQTDVCTSREEAERQWDEGNTRKPCARRPPAPEPGVRILTPTVFRGLVEKHGPLRIVGGDGYILNLAGEQVKKFHADRIGVNVVRERPRRCG